MLTQTPSGFAVLTGLSYSKLLKQLNWRERRKKSEIMLQLKSARALGDLSENAEFQAVKVEDRMNSIRISEIRGVLTTAEVMTVKSKTKKPSLNTATVLKGKGGDLRVISVVNDSEAFVDLESVGLASVDARRLLKKNLGDEIKLAEGNSTQTYKILYITSW
ncbi:MAG: hypothetical protein ACKFI0_00215 [Candidatus Hodgkinia cicadicola]